MKEGVKIKVNSKLIKKSSPSTAKPVAAVSKGGFTLAPPPPAGSTIFVNSPAEPVEKDALENADDDDDDDDDDFGDFA